VQHPNESQVDFHSYENAEYKFTISHPTTWEVQEALKPQQERALHEIVISESDYDMWRASSNILIFPNEGKQSLQEWWNAWLFDEDQKELKCREEYGDQSPCLFLRGLVEGEEDTKLGGEDALAVTLFRFDHEEVCTYAVYGEYVYGLCSAGENPNDPQASQHLSITNQMRDSFEFTARE